MAKFRSKVAEIEAWRLPNFEHADFGRWNDAVPDWLVEAVRDGKIGVIAKPAFHDQAYMEIETDAGVVYAEAGDWIIHDKGEIFPCKPSVFERKYEPIEETSNG